MDRHAQGILLLTLSAAAYSSAGFFTRLIHLDAWTMSFWRGMFAGFMILCVIVIQERHNSSVAIRAMDRPGVGAALGSTAATILYLNAFRRTESALINTMELPLQWVWVCFNENADRLQPHRRHHRDGRPCLV